MKHMIIQALNLLIIVIILSGCAEEKTINIGENIQHDDFEYSVQGVRKTDMIGNVKANGLFYIINFRVENRAKRVSHNWDNSTAYLIDISGKVYENIPEQQRNLTAAEKFILKDKYNTPSGKTESTLLVFEVPAEVKEIYLKVRGEFLMGDLFDGSKFTKTKIKLY